MSSIQSMTGYAVFDAPTPAGTVTVECRAVNSRFLDLTLRIDEALRATEPKVRERVQKAVGRGKVELRASLKGSESSLANAINRGALEQVLSLQRELLAAAPEARPLSVAELLELPGVAASAEVDREALEASVLNIVDEALLRFNAARTREGESLKAVILGYCDEMERTVSDIRSRIPEIVERIEAKLTERLTTALEGRLAQTSSLTEEEVRDRIRQEVTLYAIKLDVDEEMNRLNTHIAEVRRMLGAGGAVGRKLDFMAQEMNREANTLGSKAAAIEMTQASLTLKVTIDRMREQIQNLE